MIAKKITRYDECRSLPVPGMEIAKYGDYVDYDDMRSEMIRAVLRLQLQQFGFFVRRFGRAVEVARLDYGADTKPERMFYIRHMHDVADAFGEESAEALVDACLAEGGQ
jgi:hypothetical protein